MVSGLPEAVRLTVLRLPSAMKSFSISYGTPTFTSVLIIRTIIATLKGTHMLTIRAANLGELIIREATVEIIVEG